MEPNHDNERFMATPETFGVGGMFRAFRKGHKYRNRIFYDRSADSYFDREEGRYLSAEEAGTFGVGKRPS